MLKYGLVAAALVAILLACLGVFLAKRSAGPDEAAVKLAAAVRQAQRGLPKFRERLASPQPNDRAFFVRVQLVDPSGKAEFLWLKQVMPTATGFSGIVDEAPTLRKGLRRGDELTVTNEDVVDWTILHADKSLEGAFTQGQEIR